MKTLDEIINNENYTRLNKLLVERSIEIAQKIREAMHSADVDRVGDYCIRTVKSNAGYSDTALYLMTDTDDYCCLEREQNGYYCNDYNCYIEAATGRDRLKLLNDARSIIDEIDAIKQQSIANMIDALEAADKL